MYGGRLQLSFSVLFSSEKHQQCTADLRSAEKTDILKEQKYIFQYYFMRQ